MQAHERKDNRAPRVSHRSKNKNITYGSSRVQWAEATLDIGGQYHSEGWVLPGGQRTVDGDEALAWAKRIHRRSVKDPG